MKKFICFIFVYVSFLRFPIWLLARTLAPESTIALFGAVVWSAFPKIKSDALGKLSDRVEDLERLFYGRVVPRIGKEIIADPKLWSVLNRFSVPTRGKLLGEVLCGSDLTSFEKAIYVLLRLHPPGNAGELTVGAFSMLKTLQGQFQKSMDPECLNYLLKVIQSDKVRLSPPETDNAVYVVGALVK